MRVADARGPLAHGLGHGVLERGGARGDGHDRCAEKTHPVDIQRLADGIFLSHEDDAFHAHERRGGGGGYAVLTGAGLGNQAGLAHFFGEQSLSEHVVDLVRAGVVQILAL